MAPSCDQWSGLYETTDQGGCYALVRYDQEWVEPAVFFAVIVVVCLAALVVAQFRKG